MKDMRNLLDTFTESEWKKAKQEMTKRKPPMKIDKMTMDHFQTLTKLLPTPNLYVKNE